MKNKRRAQLAEKVYFENEIKNNQELIQKGKKIEHSIPHIRIVNEILDPYLILLKQPRPFNKIKTSQKSYTIQNSFHNQLQYLEQLKGCHFDRDILAKIVEEDSQFIPKTTQYGNTLLLDYDLNSTVQLRYFDQQKISIFLIVFLDEIQINLQQILDGELDIKDIQIQQEIMQDHTGINELLQMKQNTYCRHLYSVEVFDSNFKSKSIFKSNNILQSICLKHETDTLYMLSQVGIRNQHNYLWKQSENTLSPYQVQSLHQHYNPYCLFALSKGEIKLFDSRKEQMHTLISQDNSELMNNRFFTMHQFQEPQYLVASTNRNLQYYDLRNPQNVLFKQKHNCTETGLNQLIPLKSTLNFMNPTKFKSLDRTKLTINFEKRDILIGYNTEHKGPGVLIEFKSGVVNRLLEQPDLRVISNLLSRNSIQNSSKDQTENGVPQSIATHNIKNKYLKQRGFQSLFYKDKLFCFSLDQQGGIGLQIFEQNLDPIQINQHLNGDQMKYFEFSFGAEIDQPLCKQSKYEKIFDQLEQFSDDELELMEIPELQFDIKKKKKKKLIPIDIKEYPLQDNCTEEPGAFEDLILLNNTVDRQSSICQNFQNNNKFILTQSIIDDLCDG